LNFRVVFISNRRSFFTSCCVLICTSVAVAVTQLLWRPRGLLADQFDSKEDLINAVFTYSFITGWFVSIIFETLYSSSDILHHDQQWCFKSFILYALARVWRCLCTTICSTNSIFILLLVGLLYTELINYLVKHLFECLIKHFLFCFGLSINLCLYFPLI